MKNLPRNYLYDKLPAQVRALDLAGLVERICAAAQDRVGDLRGQIGQIPLAFESPESPGAVYDVALVYVKSSKIPGAEILTLPIPRPSNLVAWAAAELNVDEAEIASVTLSTDTERGIATPTIGFLAESIGARLYPGFYGDSSTQAAAIRSAFYLNSIRGTPDSFRILALLHGFHAAAFIPLWCRAMPRDPASLTGAASAADYSEVPDVEVDPVRNPNYGVDDLSDGPYFEWLSGWLSASQDHSQFAPIGVANTSPYISVVQSSTTVTKPAVGTYYLTGGASGVMATADFGCGLAARAVIPGAGFNGMQVKVEHAESGDLFRVRCLGNLSRIKYRSSLFDLVASYRYEDYANSPENAGGYAQPSADLAANPNLLGAQAPTAALDPYRPWTGGSIPQPVVSLWPTISSSAGAGAAVARRQALPTDRVIDWSSLTAAQSALARGVEDFRPATRHARSVVAALMLETQAAYAAYVKSSAISHVGAGNWYIVGTPYYRPNGVRGEFYVRHNGLRYPVSVSHDPNDEDQVTLVINTGPVRFSGDAHLSTGTITIDLVISVAPGSDTWYLEIDWIDNSTNVIGTEPGVGIERAYKAYPESGPVTIATTVTTDYYESGFHEYAGVLLPDSAIQMALSGVDSVACHQYPTVETESGQVLLARGYTARQSDTGYLTTTPAMVAGTTQRALMTVNSTLRSYPVGSVLGNLCACPWLYSNRAHLSGLVGWWTFSEHPDQPYQFVDSTPFMLTALESQSGGFYGSYSLESRVWNDQRGWVFSPESGTALVTKDRELNTHLTLSVWLGYSGSSSSWVDVLALGAVKLQVSNGRARFYNATAGTPIGQNVSASSAMRPMRVSLRKLQQSDTTVELAAVYTQPVQRSGLPPGIATGQKVLLTGQSAATANGVYAVNPDVWYRLAAVSGRSEALEIYHAPDGYYVCTNAPVSYGSVAPQYAKVDTAVVGANLFGVPVSGDAITVASGTITIDRTGHNLLTGASVAISGSGQNGIDGVYTITVVNLNRFTVATSSSYTGSISASVTEVYYERVSYCQLDWASLNQLSITGVPGLSLSDLRVWSEPKSLADFGSVERPVLTPDPVTIQHTCQTNKGASALQVVPSGRVFLSGAPVDQRNLPLLRVSRYAVTGEYCGHSSAKLTGYGNDVPLPSSLTLGVSGLGLPATGSVTAGNGAGTNLLLPSFRMLSDTNKPYEVGLTLVRTGASSYAPSLHAVLPRPNNARPHETAAYFGWPDSAKYAEIDSAANVLSISSSTHNTKLRLSDTPQVAFDVESAPGAVDSTVYLTPVWVREIDTATSVISPGPTSTIVGIPYPARDSAGPIQLPGHAWNLSAGRYKLVLEAVAWDEPDLDFTGFIVEARISWSGAAGETATSPVTTARLCSRGRGKFKIYSGSSYSDTLPENATSAQIAAQLTRIYGVTFNVTGESTRGPYTATTASNVYKPLPQVQLASGVEVTITSVQQGNGSQPTIFAISIVRPAEFIDIDIPSGLSTSGTWSLSLYFTNPRKTATTSRTLAICRAALYNLSHGSVYSVAVNASAVVLTEVPDSSHATGGFLQSVADDGTTAYTARSTDIAGVDPNNPRFNDRLPASDILCGSTTDRLSWVTSTRTSQANPSAPASLPQADVTLYADDGTADPNTPVLAVVTIAA